MDALSRGYREVEMTETSRARWWIYGVGLGVVVVGLLVWSKIDADKRTQQENRAAIERMEPLVAKYREALAARNDYPRPYDDLTSGSPGEAWDHYSRACALVPESSSEANASSADLVELLGANALSPEVESVLLPWREAMDAMAAGARAGLTGVKDNRPLSNGCEQRWCRVSSSSVNGGLRARCLASHPTWS